MNGSMPIWCKEELQRMAASSPTREICGFIMREWRIHLIDNIAPVDREFYMDESQQLDAMLEWRGEILGVYHSHPSGNPTPSCKDIENAPRGMRYWIITMSEVVEWEIKNGIAQAREVDAEIVA